MTSKRCQTAAPPLTRIFILEESLQYRDFLRAALGEYSDFTVAGEASTADDVEARCVADRAPDVIIVSAAEGKKLAAATRLAHRVFPQAKILITSEITNRKNVLRAIEAGASGYINREAPSFEIAQALRAMRDSGGYLSTAAARALVDTYRYRTRIESFQRLTARQLEILKLMADGRTCRQIAHVFDIKLKTAQKHRLMIMKRLGVRRQSEVIEYAARKGLIALTA
ncbi:MAG: response regulator transcription factor [Chloroflexi bacterium]|nr:response regulator transcription factor [Chloroflexota bacterium]